MALTLGETVAIFTPTDYLDPNSTYLVQLDNVRDQTGNFLENQPFSSQFGTIDTLIPIIGSLEILGNAIEGESLIIRPSLSGDDIVQLDYLVGGQFFESLSSPPYELQITLPTKQVEIEVMAIAIDTAGNQSVPQTLLIGIQENQNPSLELNNLNGSSTVAAGRHNRI